MKRTNLLGLAMLGTILLPRAAAQMADPLEHPPNLPAAVLQQPAPENPTVWLTDGLAKVQPKTAPGDARSLTIAAARNEFESFQIHVRAGAAPLTISVTVSDFVNAADGRIIAANPNVAVFREGYINVTIPSDLNGITGQVPDPLIPVQDAYFHERRNAFPAAVPANETRSAWVDVFVPPSAESGYYVASAKVADGSNVIATLPILLKVWNFTLPSTATLKSVFSIGYGGLGFAAYGDYNGVVKYPGAKGDSEHALRLIHVAVATFLLDHRVSSSLVLAPTTPGGDWKEFDSVYGPLLSGTAKTILQGARLTTLQYPNDLRPAKAPDVADWIRHLGAKGWLPLLFGYLCDEPHAPPAGGCNWSDLGTSGTAVRQLAPKLPILVTTDIGQATQNGVLGQIDILTPLVNYMHPKDQPSQRPAYDAWLKTPGKELWWYQSCQSHEMCENGKPGPATSTWPSYMVDASPVRNRVFQWLAYLYRVHGELYYWTENWGDNPWDHLYLFGGNGDGVLYYPGTPGKIGGTTPVPVASMRLKLIRDGMEDYEYLNALAQVGEGELASQAVTSFIVNAYTFKDDPAALRAARSSMGERLHKFSLQAPRLKAN